MRVVFFGTPEPALIVIEALLKSSHEIVGVVTQPDKPKGRGRQVAFSPVKERASMEGLTVKQPEKIKDNPEFAEWIKNTKADIAVVVAYGKMLPLEILNIPKHGFVNLHASLLPKYRGAAPVQWSILNGDKETGMTIFKIVPKLDAGPIISQVKVGIEPEDNTESLLTKTFKAGAQLLLETLDSIGRGTAQFHEQDEAQVTFAPLISKELGVVSWEKTAEEIVNQIRALNPWPGVTTRYHGKKLKMLKGQKVDGNGRTGEIIEIIKNKGFVVAAKDRGVLITEVQLEGGKAMSAKDFLTGHDVKIGETLSK